MGKKLQNSFPRISFVIGGAASGKSAFAENLVRHSGLDKIYIATAQAFDDEMHRKIAHHQTSRGDDWALIEEPLELARALGEIRENQVVLVDCLTLWLSNLMLAERALDGLGETLINAATDCPAPIVFVSNEVGQSIVPDTKMGRDFRNAQGRLNQEIAAAADLAVLVTAGLPTVLKGQMP